MRSASRPPELDDSSSGGSHPCSWNSRRGDYSQPSPSAQPFGDGQLSSWRHSYSVAARSCCKLCHYGIQRAWGLVIVRLSCHRFQVGRGARSRTLGGGVWGTLEHAGSTWQRTCFHLSQRGGRISCRRASLRSVIPLEGGRPTGKHSHFEWRYQQDVARYRRRVL